MPKGFKSRPQLAEEARQRAEKAKGRPQDQAQLKKAEQEARQAREDARWKKDQARIRQHLASLTPEERGELEAAALKASPFRHLKISAKLCQTTIDNFVLDLLDGDSSA